MKFGFTKTRLALSHDPYYYPFYLMEDIPFLTGKRESKTRTAENNYAGAYTSGMLETAEKWNSPEAVNYVAELKPKTTYSSQSKCKLE